MLVRRVVHRFLRKLNPDLVFTPSLICVSGFLEKVIFMHQITSTLLVLISISRSLGLMVMAWSHIFLCRLALRHGILTLALVIMFVGIHRL